MHIKKIIFAVVTGVCVAAAGIVYYVTNSKEENAIIYMDETGNEIQEGILAETSSIIGTEESIYVYVCGNVNIPGVVSVNKNARVYEVIELAGGFTANADINAINQAEFVKDGQKIYIPAIGESINYSEDNSSGLININTAGISELTTLPGIGESRAQAIIDYREQNGAFSDISEVMNISGIKQSAFDKIKSYITV